MVEELSSEGIEDGTSIAGCDVRAAAILVAQVTEQMTAAMVAIGVELERDAGAGGMGSGHRGGTKPGRNGKGSGGGGGTGSP